MTEVNERMRKAIENMMIRPVCREDIKKEEALLKLQTVSGKDISAYRTLDTERINLMTQIIMCSGFDLDEALRLSWYGPWIIELIREAQSKDIKNSLKAMSEAANVERDCLEISINRLLNEVAEALHIYKILDWIDKKLRR